MFEKIKRKLKKFAILCIPMYIFSVYFALVYQHFKSANELKWSLGPLLKDIGGLGFPFKESLIILGILLLVTGFINQKKIILKKMKEISNILIQVCMEQQDCLQNLN